MYEISIFIFILKYTKLEYSRMKLPYKAPKWQINERLLKLLTDERLRSVLLKAQQEYYHWDKVKYLKLPENVSNEDFWSVLKLSRIQSTQVIKFGKYLFRINQTPYIQKTLHEFDMNYGGKLGATGKINATDKHQYLIGSIMEEAIASSKIEGAVTTRKAAKDMLKQNRSPRNKSERMILNNYSTIYKVREFVNQPLNKEKILEIQGLMTSQTLQNPKDEGQFRTDNSVTVVDVKDGEIMYQPPSFEELDGLMNDVYDFFNTEDEKQFLHPIIKACILHFIIGFIHPFVDGNGRTARALFYWYMLKKGYWLTEYLSISAPILKSKTQYGLAFMYTENDDLDLTYFINYKMGVIRSAYDGLQGYIQRKIEEKNAAYDFMRKGGVNERQAQIIQWIDEEPNKIITAREVQKWFGVANQTARYDLQGLIDLGILELQQVDKKSRVYIRTSNFNIAIKKIR